MVHVCSLTIEYQVFQIVPEYKHFRTMWENTFDNSPKDFVSSSSKWWSSMQEKILCRVAESSCLPTHKIVPNISLHDQPCHKTMKKYVDFEGMVISLLSPQKFAKQKWFWNCQQKLCLFRIVVEWSPSIHDPRMMLVLPNRLLCWKLTPHRINIFFPANLMSPTYTDTNNPFSRWTKRHSQFGNLLPIHVLQ